ncbi:transposase family protein [Actinosynnema sp. NPDC023794]
MPDPRPRWGRWHSLTAILLVCACATVSGAKSIDELAEWAAPSWHRDSGGHRTPPPPAPLTPPRSGPRSAAYSNASMATRSTGQSALTWPTAIAPGSITTTARGRRQRPAWNVRSAAAVGVCQPRAAAAGSHRPPRR